MSSPVSAAASVNSSTIDEQLRLRIAEELAGSFKGDVIGPGHAEYEQARQLWNAMADRRPGLILRCTSTQDVVAAVGVARDARDPLRRPQRGRQGHVGRRPHHRPVRPA